MSNFSSKKELIHSDRYCHTSDSSVYDIFFSFRGSDVRSNFIDTFGKSLTRNGHTVFKDDEDIYRGKIGGQLMQVIRSSRVYVVVFSRNYASSARCLQELEMIVDVCRGSNNGGKIILPIFYGIDPADVKLRRRWYRKALDKHKDKYGEDVVEKWEEALKTVGGISGWECNDFEGGDREDRFVQLIVRDIVAKLDDRRHHIR